MKKYFGVYIAFCLALTMSCASCKKTDVPIELIPASPAIDTELSDTPNPLTESIPSDATVYRVGTGSGSLTIDGKNYSMDKNVLIKVKGGTYTTINIKNLLAPKGMRIFIKNDGEVKVSDGMHTDNINNVTISGYNATGLTYGIKFENIPYRAITMNGKMSGVTLRNLSFKKVANYAIAGERSNGPDLNYKGSAETRTENFKILNCYFENAGPIIFGGQLNKDAGEDSGFFKDVEIAYNRFENAPNVGSVCTFTNVEDYNIHNNVVNNINQNNNNHNGVFYMQGNGIFHSNKLTNYQGNAIRMWLYSRGTKPKTNEIYNNVCYNTRKYGGFELQAFKRNLITGKTTFANAKVYNNTVGQMNTSKDWEGQILDLYYTGGTLEYYNNLGFGLVATNNNSITNMINNMSDTKIIKQQNNKYEPEKAKAVTSDLKSRFPNIGALNVM
jgi:hypothetical protein